MTQTTSRRPRPWRVAILTGMASYLDSALLVASGSAVSVLYAPLFDLGPAQIGLGLACQQLAFGVGAFFGGRLGDRFGRRKVLTTALVAFAVALAVLASASAVWMLFVGVVGAGLAVGADLPVALSMANENAPKNQKGRMVVLAALLWTLGIASVQLVLSFVGDLGPLGARILFGEILVTTVVVIVLRLRIPESAEWAAARAAAAQAVTTAANGGGAEPVDRSRLLRAPIVVAMIGIGLFYAAWNVGASINGKYGGYMWTTLAGGDLSTFSRYSLLALPLTFMASLLFMRLVDTRWRRPVVVVGSVLIVLGWLPLVVLGATPLSILSIVFVFNLGSAFAGEALYEVWSQELIPTLLRGTVQGFTMLFARIIAAALALVVPPLLAARPEAVFVGVFVCAVLAVLVSQLWLARLKPAPSQPFRPDVEREALPVPPEAPSAA